MVLPKLTYNMKKESLPLLCKFSVTLIPKRDRKHTSIDVYIDIKPKLYLANKIITLKRTEYFNQV